MTTWALVLAGGTGERFGGAKQFQMLGRQRLVDWSVERSRATCDGVTLVLPDPDAWDGERVDACVAGGATHADSTRRGLEAVPAAAERILIVTVAHPLATEALFRRVLDALVDGVDSVAPLRTLPDAIKRVDDAQIIASIDKRSLMAVQAPSAFRASVLRSAIAAARGDFPEEHELIESVGGTIIAVSGEDTNLHLTTPTELAMAEAILSTLDER